MMMMMMIGQHSLEDKDFFLVTILISSVVKKK